MVFMGKIFSDKENDVIKRITTLLSEGYDFDNKLDDLTTEEKYAYIGMCSGVNSIITMVENRLEEKSAPFLNYLFEDDIFVWDAGNEKKDPDDMDTLVNGILAETVENTIAEAMKEN